MRSRSNGGRLLLASLVWAGSRGPELASLAAGVRRWRPLLARAGRAGVGETLAYALAASGAEDALPAEIRDRVRAARQLGAARNLGLLSEAARVQDLLSRRGIASVALKGTALVAAHYPEPGARHVGDLDLLVPPARVTDAASLLEGEGAGSGPNLDHRGKVAPSTSHAPRLETAGGISCDVHHHVPGHPRDALAERVLGRAREVEVAGGRALRITAPVDSAAIACLHAFAGHHGAAAHLPRLVADLEALEATGGLDWTAIEEVAGPEGADAVRSARALLDAARAGCVEAVFPGKAAVLARELLGPFARAAAADPRAGVRTFFPARRFMAARYGVPERSARLLLYYVARPFIALRARLRG